MPGKSFQGIYLSHYFLPFFGSFLWLHFFWESFPSDLFAPPVWSLSSLCIFYGIYHTIIATVSVSYYIDTIWEQRWFILFFPQSLAHSRLTVNICWNSWVFIGKIGWMLQGWWILIQLKEKHFYMNHLTVERQSNSSGSSVVWWWRARTLESSRHRFYLFIFYLFIFKVFYWICCNIASVLCFGSLAVRHVGA